MNSIYQKLAVTAASAVVSLTIVEANPLVNMPTAMAATTLFDGSGLPDSAGWNLNSFVDEPEDSTITVVPQSGGDLSDVLSVSTTGRAVHLYSKNVGATNYIISMGVRVLRSSFNSYDWGLGLSPFAQQVFTPSGEFLFSYPDRVNSLTIGEGSIQWSDLIGGSFVLDTSVFHEYAISYIDNKLNVYVDSSFDDIAAGTAVPLLTRTRVSPNPNEVGIVAFGDQSNDGFEPFNCCVNSAYQLNFVKFRSVPTIAVPEPNAVSALIFLGLSGLLMKKKLVSSRRA